MNIITPKQSAQQTTREEWVETFCRLLPGGAVTHIPTGYRDMGAAVRFRFSATGAEAEWLWLECSAAQAAEEARAAELVV